MELRKTPLYNEHVSAGARMVEFAGWLMPVQYTGIIEEHQAVREKAGLFDVSHMGEIEVSGNDALDLVARVITNDPRKLVPGRAIYSPMCNAAGGVVDDVLVYCLDSKIYLFVVNASNIEADLAWLKEHTSGDVRIADQSRVTGQMALQGPAAQRVLGRLVESDLGLLPRYRFFEGPVAGVECLVARTGYTGEDGFEIYVPAGGAVMLWRAILAEGKEEGIKPVGLGARDTLRLEAGLTLYGHELAADISPLEAGLNRFVRQDDPGFIGGEALQKIRLQGLTRRLVGIWMEERGIPRPGYPVELHGTKIGHVTSGTFSPTLHHDLGMGLVSASEAYPGNQIDVLIRGKKARGRIVPLPFYKRKEEAQCIHRN